ncbi:MAG: preprotein translocase subunit YajC [Pseudomonadota bacterium]
MNNIIEWIIPAAHAAPTPAAPAPADPGLFQFLLIIGMFAMFYFILIRPQKKRQKAHEEMVNQLNQGDEVATHAGILGTIKVIKDDFIVLKVSDSVELKFQRSAVHIVLPKGTIKDIQ